MLLHIIGQPLGALADRPVIDCVRTNGVHAAAPSAGAERDHRPECIIQLLPFRLLDVFDDQRRILCITWLGQPRSDVLGRVGRQQALPNSRLYLLENSTHLARVRIPHGSFVLRLLVSWNRHNVQFSLILRALW
jgi:hypothetical protein